jgi:hypothetical protein
MDLIDVQVRVLPVLEPEEGHTVLRFDDSYLVEEMQIAAEVNEVKKWFDQDSAQLVVVFVVVSRPARVAPVLVVPQAHLLVAA